MKNSWRISPRSSACARFVDKKRDHDLKELPENCDVCGRVLPNARTNPIICGNCRTRYFKTERRVRVLTAYEDEFEEAYLELAGRTPWVDITGLRERRSSEESTFGVLERLDFEKHRFSQEDGKPQPITVLLFPGDNMLTRDGQLFLLGRRRVEKVPLAGTTIVDHGVLGDEQTAELRAAGAILRSVVRTTTKKSEPPPDVKYELGTLLSARDTDSDLTRSFAIAMAKSAIHATTRIGPIAGLDPSVLGPLIDQQNRYLKRLEGSRGRHIPYEGITMRRYWECYDMALKIYSQRFGPHKKARFVREQTSSPTARAKGYTAIDSAINYLHQRRVFKVRQINSGLGISAYGEGLIHRRRWKTRGLGLVLDLSDPLKFADREKLLEAVLNFTINWRDFHMASDRQGVTFYYPKSEAIPVLERIGEEADDQPIEYDGSTLELSAAYERSVTNLVAFLVAQKPSFEPFVYNAEAGTKS